MDPVSSASEPMAFLNGQLISFRSAQLPIYDLGLMQGATLTERLRTIRHQPYLVEEHLDRLEQGLDMAGWEDVPSREEFVQMIHELARMNSQRIASEADLALVVFVTAGQSVNDSNGLIGTSRCTTCLYTAPLPLPLWGRTWKQGQSLIVPEIRSLPGTTLDSRLKHRSRLHWAMADRQARQSDPLASALLLNEHGEVTETSTGNLFLMKEGVLQTTPAGMTLPGIAQAQVLRIAAEMGIPVHRVAITLERVFEADEVFLTSSTYCLLPVSRVNGERIGRKLPGPITQVLANVWSAEIGLNFCEQACAASDASQ